LKKFANFKKLVIFLLLIFMVIAGRLAVDVQSDAYKSAISALYQSKGAREFVDGRIFGTVLVGLSNRYQTSTVRGSRTSVKCASRLFLVRGEKFGFVEVTMRAEVEPDSEWQVREILLGWFATSSVPCP
jgi:hypothetical protein